jgi:acetyl-CoA carboxylase biotin carboxyl carrier protein
LDIRKVKKLIELLEESNVAEIEIKEGEESVRVTKSAGPVLNSSSIEPTTTLKPQQDLNTIQSQTPPEADGTAIKAPMVGTFYSAPSPDALPFVQVGKNVKAGDTLCIIEAMKIMNPIEAESSGVISAILVDNGQPVEFDQPLFMIS